MKEEEGLDLRHEIRELLRFYDRRLDDCTMQQLKATYRMLAENLEMDGTVADFAEFYGKSRDAVSGVIKRRMVQKPKRNVVLYPFHAFRKIVPPGWRKK